MTIRARILFMGLAGAFACAALGADQAAPKADPRIELAGKIPGTTPDELRASDKPSVHQFVHGEMDGPMPFHYPADDYGRDLYSREA